MNYTRTLLLLAAGLFALLPASRAQEARPASPTAPHLAAAPMLPTGQKAAPAPNPYRNVAITTRLIPGAHQTYGYEVLVNGRVLITQPVVPGIEGTDGFRSAAEAQKVAALVAGKLRDNQMPPTVTEAELQRLHVGQ